MASGGFRLERLGAVESTQTLLRERLQAGEDIDRLVLRAAEQRSGRGRFDRRWRSAPGGSYQSVGLIDPDGSMRVGRIGLAIAAGVAHSLSGVAREIGIKWPNDLYLRPAFADGSGTRLLGKLGGVLCEHLRGHLLVGIGINVANEAPPEAARIEGVPPDVVGDLVLTGIETGLELLRDDARFTRELTERDLLRGRGVRLETPAGEISGTAVGVGAGGALLLDVGGRVLEMTEGRVTGVDAAFES